jgi:hypothetical protein
LQVHVSTRYDAATKLTLRLTGDSFPSPILYTIVGDDKDAQYLSSELDRLLRDHFQWYSGLNTIPVELKLIVALILLTGGAFCIVFGSVSIKVGDRVLPPHEFLRWIGILMVLIPPLYYSIRKTSFPTATFSIGDGIARAHKVENFRRGVISIVFVAIGVGLIVQLFGTALARYFGVGH